MNTTIGSYRPCCWEDVDDDCLAPALPDSLWCAKHTAWAKIGYDPGMDALNARRGLPPSYPQSEFANRESQIADLPSPGSGEGSGVRGRGDPLWSTLTQLLSDHPESEIANRESQIANGLPTASPPRAHDLPTDSRRPADDLSTACPGAVSPSEPAETPSDTFKQSKRRIRPTPPVAPRCTATTALGQPCRAYARRRPRASSLEPHASLCIYHDPTYAEDLRANGEKGGRAYVKSHFAPPDPLDEIMSLPLDLSSRGSVQAAIDGILRMHLSGQLSPRRSGPILQLLGLAMRNVSTDGTPAAFAESYHRAAPQFRRTTKRAIQHIANEDLRQRVNEISDVKSKRQAFLQANDEFGYPYHVEKR